jgi:hypothetical protein
VIDNHSYLNICEELNSEIINPHPARTYHLHHVGSSLDKYDTYFRCNIMHSFLLSDSSNHGHLARSVGTLPTDQL